jgi:hypothetical protein
MDQVLALLKTYDGVIGAVLGTVLGSISTLFATHWLKNKGKVTFKIKEFNTEFSADDGIGGRKPTKELDDKGYAKIKISIDIYNSSENIKTLNNICYELVDDTDNVIFTGDLADLDTGVFSAGVHRFDDFKYMNCKPKELIKKDLQTSFGPSNILLLSITKKVVVKADVENESLFTFWRKRVKKEIRL